MAVRPLEGLRVLDLGTALAGPVCATILGEFGAEVIKVEHPRGDPLRTFGPSVDSRPLWWMIEGRNKRSITLDFSRPEARPIVHRLIEKSDVLVENFRPGTMARWGLDYARVSEINRRLVYVSVSGFGQTGPYRERAAYDRVAQAMAGLTYLTGHPGQPPVKPGLGVTDYSTAFVAALGAMLALYERDAAGSGFGQQVDATLTESILRMFHYYVPLVQLRGVVPERVGNAAEAMAPAECFRTRDGIWIMVAAGTQRTFALLTEALHLSHLVNDPRFLTNQTRSANQDELHRLLREAIAECEASRLLRTLEDVGVPASRLYTARDVFQDPHFRERGSITTATDPVLGEVWMQGVVPRLTRTPGRIDTTGPVVGADNDIIYIDLLGLSEPELATLRAGEVI